MLLTPQNVRNWSNFVDLRQEVLMAGMALMVFQKIEHAVQNFRVANYVLGLTGGILTLILRRCLLSFSQLRG